jgi:hypothetical protein
MKYFLQSIVLFLSPLILNASGDTLKAERPPVKRWNITISTGYGFSFAGEPISSVTTVDANSNIVGKLKTGTYGKGIFSFISTGYAINKHFGSEFGIHSTWGNKITSKVTNLANNLISDHSLQVSTNGVFAGLFMTDTYGKFHLSFHNDFLVGVLNYATEETMYNNVKQPAWKYSGRLSYGWLSRISGSYDISEKLKIGISSFFLMHSWSPKQKSYLNGQNKYTFTDDILESGIYPIQSDKLPRITYPLHAAGINLFITYNF